MREPRCGPRTKLLLFFSQKQTLGSLCMFTTKFMDEQVGHSMESPETNPVFITLTTLEAKETILNASVVRSWALLAPYSGGSGKSQT